MRHVLTGRSRGQVIVLIAFVMIVVLGFTALAIDGGELYLLRRKAQNAADAAVIAAVYDLCKDPYQADPSSPANVAVLTSPTTRTYDAIQSAIGAAADNGFTITESDVTFPDAPNYNHILVTVTATKQARLVQVVYQGPLVVSAYSEGTCTKAHTTATGMAMVGLGMCSGHGGEDGIAFTGSDFTLNGGYATNANATFGASVGHQGHINACPTGVTTGQCTSAPAGTTGLGSDPPSSDSKILYSPQNPAVVTAATNYPSFWNIADFKAPGGAVYYAANQLGIYHSYTGNISGSLGWDAFGGGINKTGTNLTPGIYFVDGDFTPSTSNVKSAKTTGVTLVATGQIDVGLTGSDTNTWTLYQFPKLWPIDTPDGLHSANDPNDPIGIGVMPVLFTPTGTGACQGSSSNPAVHTNGNFTFVGVIYAPGGMCVLHFPSAGSADGATVCVQVNISGSSFLINFNPRLMPPFSPTGGIAH